MQSCYSPEFDMVRGNGNGMRKIKIATVIVSAAVLLMVWIPEVGREKPRMLPPGVHACIEPAPPSAWPEIRATITWAIGTVNGVMLIATAVKGRRRRKSR